MARAKKKKVEDEDEDEDEDDIDDADEPKPRAKTKARPKDKADGPRARNDAYVMMLFITLVAMLAGTVLMYLDHEEYGGKQPPKEPVPAVQKLGEASKAPPPPAPKGVDDTKVAEPKGVDPMGMPMGMMPPP